jgi:uncharacterized protein (TIGR03067 family)
VTKSIAPFVALFLSGLVVAADAPKSDDAASRDRQALQGTWQSVKEEMRGGPAPGDPRDHQMIFSGDSFRLVEGDKVLIRGTFKLDAGKSPKVMEMTITEGAGPDPEAPSHGIYELNGDELKWCASEPGTDGRPGKFDTKGTTNVSIQLKRQPAK